MNVVFLSGLILGLTSSFHCVGMCGPIAMVLPLNRKNNWITSGQILLYNLGRILTYSVLGLLIGMVGFTFNTFQILQWISIVSGIILVMYAWRKIIGKISLFSSLNSFSVTNKLFGKIIKSNSPFKLFLLGNVNGLLPCGMVYVALLNAILTGDVFGGALAMMFFGIGTIPMMFFVSFSASKISSKTRADLNKLTPVLLTIVGCMIILRGMNLGIPYISPKISAPQQKTEVVQNQPKVEEQCDQEVQMECCHSKK